jgi:hypothetical protein
MGKRGGAGTEYKDKAPEALAAMSHSMSCNELQWGRIC